MLWWWWCGGGCSDGGDVVVQCSFCGEFQGEKQDGGRQTVDEREETTGTTDETQQVHDDGK